MSTARKCDRCDKLYEVAKGVVAIDVHIATKNDDAEWEGWSDVDFCPACSVLVLGVIGTAIRR